MKPTLITWLLGLALSLTASAAEWKANFDFAKAEASRDKKPILLNFTGSDWCPPCMQMKKDVLDKRAFLDFAARKLVLVEVDFPRRKRLAIAQTRANSTLQSKYGVRGFPTFVLLSPEGKELGRHEGYYKGGPDAFIKWIESKAKKAPAPTS